MKELIRKILKEEISSKDKLRSMVNNFGWEQTANLVGGIEQIIKILYDGNEIEYYKDRVREIIKYQMEIQQPGNFDDADEYADFCISQSMDLFFNEDTDSWSDDEDDEDNSIDIGYDEYEDIQNHMIDEFYDELVEFYNDINN
jgi:hypothetical protein